MRYYAQYSGDELIAVGTGPGGTEITEEQYNAILAELQEKRELADRLYAGEITIDDVPERWRDEVQKSVDERREIEETEPDDYERALKIILGEEE